MRLSSRAAVIVLGGLLTVPVFGLAACGTTEACAGQCGPPFQAQVIFRPGTSTRMAAAVMSNCAWKPFVIRFGDVSPFGGPKSAEPPGSVAATVYTKSLFSRQSDRLLACLHRSPSVISAGYPD
ncbi:MAG: hypothetical protein ACRDNF_16935 [Streptosporangiaceae bacterium]